MSDILDIALPFIIPKGDKGDTGAQGEVPAAALATKETSTTASKAYSVGDYLYYNSKLYRVTASIASGGTITPNTNCVEAALADDVTNVKSQIDEAPSDAIKTALLQIASKVAYIDGDGQDYYDDLYCALYHISSIDAVFTQGSTVVYELTPLDALKELLVVTATLDYGGTKTLDASAYTLTGTLEVGTSTITVNCHGKTDTITVTVSAETPANYTWLYQSSNNVKLSERTDIIDQTISAGSTTSEAITDGLLHIVTGGVNTYLQYNLKPTSNTIGVLTVKARCNILTGTSTSSVGFRILVSNGTAGAAFAVSDTDIKYAENNTTKALDFPAWFDFTEWHIYQVEQTSDGKQIGYIDGIKLFEKSVLSKTYTSINRIGVIGSGTSPTKNNVDIEWAAYWDGSST